MVLGTLIGGKYELAEVAGEGGMATVYKAVVRGAAGFARTVAVKRIRPEYRAIKNYVDMFVEEARVGSELAHSNIVQVYDFIAEPDGSYCLVMEWVDGIDVGSLISAYRDAQIIVPWRIIASIGIGTLRGLGAAHARRDANGLATPVIHRDVSPHNILLGTNGSIKLTDFGLARARDRLYSLTAPGTVKGKLCYLAPEVSWGKEATPLSDVFALGAVLWEGLVSRRLFEGKTDLEVFRKLRACEVPSVLDSRPDVPDRFADAIARALSREPEARFASAIDMAAELAEVLKESVMGGDSEQAVGNAVVEARRLARGLVPPDFDQAETPRVRPPDTQFASDEVITPRVRSPQNR